MARTASTGPCWSRAARVGGAPSTITAVRLATGASRAKRAAPLSQGCVELPGPVDASMTSPVDSRSDNTGTTVVCCLTPRTVTVTAPGCTGSVPAPTSTTMETCRAAPGNTVTTDGGAATAGTGGPGPTEAPTPTKAMRRLTPDLGVHRRPMP